MTYILVVALVLLAQLFALTLTMRYRHHRVNEYHAKKRYASVETMRPSSSPASSMPSARFTPSQGVKQVHQ